MADTTENETEQLSGSATAGSALRILEPNGARKRFWSEIWRFRDLFLVLAWRDIAVRYKQTVVGVAWAVARPLLTMIIFTVVFGRVAGLPSDGAAPYALMVFAGMLPWFLFAAILSEGSLRLVNSAQMIRKIYFPRIIIPVSAAAVAIVDFLIGLVLFVLLMVWFSYAPSWRFLLLPVFMALAVAASLGPALIISALAARYRDVQFVMPFIVQFGLYVSPVGYSMSAVPEEWRLALALNPMVSVIDGFRWSLLGTDSAIHGPSFVIGTTLSLIFLWLGVRYFRRVEHELADHV